MKRHDLNPLSYRLLPLLLAVAAVGILAVTIDVWWITLIVVGVLAIPLGVLACVRKRPAWGIVATCLVLYAALGIVAVEVEQNKMSYYAGYGAVVGRVAEVRSSDGYVTGFVLDSLTIRGEKVQGKCLVQVGLKGYVDGDVPAEYTVGTPIATGSWVRVWGKLSTVRLDYYDSYSMHRVLQGIYYSQDAEELYLQSTAPVLHASEKAQLAILKVLVDRMGWQAGSLGYAMLLGRTGKLTEDVVVGYRSVGIAHLLAVSGLHVGLLLGLVLLLLKACRCPVRWRWLPTLAILLPYAWLCGWSPSVLRAGTLAVVALVAKSLGRRFDPPSMWSLAALVLLLVRPLWLLDVSFLLSFAAYGGIIVLLPLLREGWNKLAERPRLAGLAKVPKWLKDTLSINLAVTVTITPLSVYFFGGISWLTIPFNLVFVPLMSLVYTVLFVGTILGLIWSGFGVFLYPVLAVVTVVNRTMMWVGKSGFLPFHFGLAGIPLCYGGMVAASPYCRYRPVVKYPLAASLAVVGVLLSVFLAAS